MIVSNKAALSRPAVSGNIHKPSNHKANDKAMHQCCGPASSRMCGTETGGAGIGKPTKPTPNAGIGGPAATQNPIEMVMQMLMQIIMQLMASLFGASQDSDSPKKGTLGDELLTNGGFDNHDTLKRGGKWDTFKNIDGWKADKGHIEIQNGAVGGTKTAKGNNVVELDAHANSTISQTVNIKEGGKYEFSMDTALRGGNKATNGFEVLVNGKPVFSGTPGSQDLNNLKLELDLPAGKNKISIRGTGKSDSIGTIIDNVSLKQKH